MHEHHLDQKMRSYRSSRMGTTESTKRKVNQCRFSCRKLNDWRNLLRSIRHYNQFLSQRDMGLLWISQLQDVLSMEANHPTLAISYGFSFTSPTPISSPNCSLPRKGDQHVKENHQTSTEIEDVVISISSMISFRL